MANYSLVINSKFQPFSFERYIQPYQMYGEAYKEIENQYGELATKANVWDEIANEQTDPYAYKMYKTYSNDLEEQAGQLAREGLTPASRQNMLRMKQRYSSDIVPIEQAYQRRQELVDEQRKLLTQDNTLMFDKNASMLSLDDLIKNPQLTYQSYSGATLAKQVATAAQNLAKNMRENPRKWRDILDKQYFETIMQHGYRPEEIIQVLQNDPNASSVLKSIVEDAVGSSNIASWGDKDTLNRAYEYARQGLWNAVGETQYQTLQNQSYLNPLQKLQKRKLEREPEPNTTVSNLAINPLNIYSSRELNEDEKNYNDNIKKYSKYFYKEDGQWKMTDEGWKEYNRKISGTSGDTKQTPEGITILTNVRPSYSNSPFKDFMDSIGDVQRNTAGDVWNKYVDDSPAAKTAKYDATMVTEYDYSIAGSQQDDMKDAIMTANRGLSLKEVDYDSKSNKFKETGKELTMKDLKSDRYKVTATRFSPYGNTVMVQDNDGNVRRFKMPAGINITNEQNRDRAMIAANQWQQVVNTGQYTDARGNVHQATPDEITYAQQQYAQAIQQAYLFHSQLGVQNTVKEQEFNPYGY